MNHAKAEHVDEPKVSAYETSVQEVAAAVKVLVDAGLGAAAAAEVALALHEKASKK